MVRDFGADGDVGLLNPDRVSGWFDYVWGDKAPKTYNLRLTAVSAACAYWRDQQWLTGDPVSRLRARPSAPDNSKAMTAAVPDTVPRLVPTTHTGLPQRLIAALMNPCSSAAALARWCAQAGRFGSNCAA